MLRRIAGDVGGAHDMGDGRDLIGDFHDADAGADREHAALPGESIIADALPQVFRDAQRLVARTILQQDAKLIAAEARESAPAPHPRLNHAGNLLQQQVARRLSAVVLPTFESDQLLLY